MRNLSSYILFSLDRYMDGYVLLYIIIFIFYLCNFKLYSYSYIFVPSTLMISFLIFLSLYTFLFLYLSLFFFAFSIQPLSILLYYHQDCKNLYSIVYPNINHPLLIHQLSWIVKN